MANNAILLVNLGEKMNRHAPYSADYTWDIISGIPRSRNPFFHEERLEEPIRKKSPQFSAVP